jgi:HK97 family phage prohead protease
MTDELLAARTCERSAPLEDLHIRSDGSGRIVEAYAAAFNVKSEIVDQDGHYHESITPTAFNRTIKHKAPGGFGVLFNHGRTVDGTPSDAFSMPIGIPLEVVADERGVFTATRYLDNPVADGALNAIKHGAIKAQSFSGRFTKSARSYPQGRGRGSLPLITRMEVDMREYGPAVFAAYSDATILGTRAEQFVRSLLATPPDQRADWLAQFEILPTLDPAPGEDLNGTPSEDGPAAMQTEDPQPALHSARSLASRIHAARIARGIE